MKAGLRMRTRVPTQRESPFWFQNAQLNQVAVCDLCLACQFSLVPHEPLRQKIRPVEFSIGTG